MIEAARPATGNWGRTATEAQAGRFSTGRLGQAVGQEPLTADRRNLVKLELKFWPAPPLMIRQFSERGESEAICR